MFLHYIPKHGKCHCAAIATAFAGVAAAGTAAYSASQAGSSAGAAGAAANANPSATYGTKPKPVEPINNVGLIPGYNPTAGTTNLANSLPELNTIAANENKFQSKLRNKTSPDFSANLNLEGGDINSLLSGSVPQDVIDNTNRIVAERSGGAFMPEGPGNQMPSDTFARDIGQTSTQLMQSGLSYAPQWESMVDAFTYSPQTAFQNAMSMLGNEQQYTLNADQLQSQIDSQQYQENVDYSMMRAAPNPAAAGAINTNLQVAGLQNQAGLNESNALLGAIKAGSALYSSSSGSSSTSSPSSIYSIPSVSSSGTPNGIAPSTAIPTAQDLSFMLS